MNFLHENKRFLDVLESISRSMNISVAFVEKDYWIMHSLYGLQQQGFDFYLKGGTSLSKAFLAIERFSEDIDIMIIPPANMKVMIGKNQDKDIHRQSRKSYFEWLLENISISGVTQVYYDELLRSDGKYRNADIRLKYPMIDTTPSKLKEGILLEVGFDQVEPFTKKNVSSWAYDFAKKSGMDVLDNRAIDVRCYNPEYTFVEKLSAISKKFRQYQELRLMDKNFMRHYYDIYMLLKLPDVQKFLGTENYLKHKTHKFGPKDEFDLTKNEAFIMSDKSIFNFFSQKHNENEPLHYDGKFPSFQEIMSEIGKFRSKM